MYLYFLHFRLRKMTHVLVCPSKQTSRDQIEKSNQTRILEKIRPLRLITIYICIKKYYCNEKFNYFLSFYKVIVSNNAAFYGPIFREILKLSSTLWPKTDSRQTYYAFSGIPINTEGIMPPPGFAAFYFLLSFIPNPIFLFLVHISNSVSFRPKLFF